MAGERLSSLARSLTATIVFLHIQDDDHAALFESQKSVITTLTKGCKSVEVVRDVSQVPSGCGSTVLTSTISVHILVRVSFSLSLFSLLFS
jgi:valyl-tRNA synthetase